MDRRAFLRVSAAAGVVGTAVTLKASSIVAQDGTPVAQDSSPTTEAFQYIAEEFGLPELALTATDEGYEGPSEIAAGRYLVTVTNASTFDYFGAGFIQAPEGQTAADIEARFAEIDAYFEAMFSGTPVSGEDPTAFLYDVVMAGGPASPAGYSGVVQGIVDLTPGEWLIWNEDFSLPTGQIVVTGEMPADLPQPTAAAVIREVDDGDTFDFQIEGTISAGPQVIEVVNESSQPHFVSLMILPVPLNDEQVLELLGSMMEEGGTPDAESELPSLDEIVEGPATASQSTDTTQWMLADFEPGHYAALCFIPDPRHEGAPHSAMGMVATFTVS